MTERKTEGIKPITKAVQMLFKRQLENGYKYDRAYPYRMDSGQILFWRVVLRKKGAPKFVRPVHRADGKFEIGEPEPPKAGKPLYDQQVLIARKDEDVWFVEGEGCVHVFRKYGLVATTSGSATSAEGADFRCLAGRVVYLMPDNDDKGREYMEVVGNKLQALGCTVFVIDTEKLGVPESGDIVDFVRHNPKTRVKDIVRFKDQAQPFVGSGDRYAGDLFPEPLPWPVRIDGLKLYRKIKKTLNRFVIADHDAIVAATLWIFHTWCLDCFGVSPIAHIVAADKRCGKTVFLTLLGKLSRRPLQVSNVTPALLFRVIESHHPTLLIDEADTFISGNEVLRGIIDSGHTRDSARVMRVAGEDFTPKSFSTWCAKAICGIGSLPPTIEDRSLPLAMKRKLDSEVVDKIRHEPRATWIQLRAKIARYMQDNINIVGTMRPKSIQGLSDRANDSWEPLLAIAKTIDSSVLKEARVAARNLHCSTDSLSDGSELIRDIWNIFKNRTAERIFTRDIVEDLIADVDGPWARWKRGAAISGNDVARLLEPYKICPMQIRIGSLSKKGYKKGWFKDAYFRYVVGQQSN